MNIIESNKKSNQLAEIWRRFKMNKLAVIGLIILVMLILMAIFADVIAPYGFDDQDYSNIKQLPSFEHIMGTDNLGRDIFSRIVYGSRVSLSVGFAAVLIGVLFGGTLGAIGGYWGGRLENVIMRCMDILMAIPSMIMAISICAALGAGIVNTVIAVGFSTIPNYARIMRAAVITAKQQEYVEAARAVGSSDFHIIVRHIIPNSMAPLIVQSSLGVAQAILAAASMSFIGLGITPPNPEWGAMLADGRTFFRQTPHLIFFPGLMIMLVIFAINLFGDGLRDALDPRLKR